MARRAVIREDGDAVVVEVLVVPNASHPGIVGLHGDRIRIRVAAPPERGKANLAVERLVRQATGARLVVVISGANTRTKSIHLWGVGIEKVRKSLLEP